MEALARVFHQGPGECESREPNMAGCSTAVLHLLAQRQAVDDESDQERRNDELENRRGACVLGKPL